MIKKEDKKKRNLYHFRHTFILSGVDFVAKRAVLGFKTKILKGFGSAAVMELVLRDRSGTFRVIYTVKFENVIYVLHSFQKKSKSGIKTPKQEVDLIHNRLKNAEADHKERLARRNKK